MNTQHQAANHIGKPSIEDLARLDKREVCRLVGRSPSSLDEMRREGRFPEPDYRDGPRCVRWSAGLVRRWLEATRVQTC